MRLFRLRKQITSGNPTDGSRWIVKVRTTSRRNLPTNPTDGSRWIVKVQPYHWEGWTLSIPQLPLGEFGKSLVADVGWTLSIPQLPLGGLPKCGLKFLQTLTAFIFILVLAFAARPLALSAVANSTVKGRIELVNTKLKSRDAGGIVVWLKPADGSSPRGSSKQRKVINQRDKRFSPHIVAVEVGSEVDFPNEDPYFHNVFSIFNGRRFDLGLYASGETRPVNFNRPGISYIFCNIHPKMSAIVVALDTPYFAVSDKTGSFVINNVPAGDYRLSLWHERAKPETLAVLTREVKVANDADLGTISVSEEGYVPRPHPNKHGQEYDSQNNKPGYRKP